MGRRLHDLTPDALDALPDACRACVFWEVAGAPRGPLVPQSVGRDAKDAWWQATQLEWGAPGKALYVDDLLAAYAAFAPSRHYPAARGFGHTLSEDALLLATLWVDPRYAGGGLGKMLVQAVLREAYRHGARAVEAVAERGRTAAPGATGGCVLPEPFLLALGFTVAQEHHRFPLLRVELRQAVAARWLGQALEGVLGALARRERAPAPARPALEATRSSPVTAQPVR